MTLACTFKVMLALASAVNALPAEKLTIEYRNESRDRGKLLLSATLSRAVSSGNSFGQAELRAVVKPEDADIFLGAKSIPYELREGRFAAEVPYRRDPTRDVLYSISLVIRDDLKNRVELIARDRLGPTPFESPARTEQAARKTSPAQLPRSALGDQSSPGAVDDNCGSWGRLKPVCLTVQAMPMWLIPVLLGTFCVLVAWLGLKGYDHWRAHRSEARNQALLDNEANEPGGYTEGRPGVSANQVPDPIVEPQQFARSGRLMLQSVDETARRAEAYAKLANKTGDDIMQSMVELRRSVEDLRSQNLKIASQLLALGEDPEIRAVASVFAPKPVVAVLPESSTSLSWEEQVLLAAANRWIGTGSADRQELLALAITLGVSARLAEHSNASRTVAAFPGSVYEFRSSEREGGWLWLDLPGRAMSLAVPSDARAFHIGKGPEFLALLCDGLTGAPEQFRFDRVFRACRLRRRGSGIEHDLLAKGLLHVKGTPAPDVSPPPDYYSLQERYERSQKWGEAVRSPQLSLASAVRSQLEMIAQRLDAFQAAISRLGSEQAGGPAGIEKRVEELARNQRLLQDQIAQLQREIQQLRADFETNPDASKPVGDLTGLQGQVSRLNLLAKALQREVGALKDWRQRCETTRGAPPNAEEPKPEAGLPVSPFDPQAPSEERPPATSVPSPATSPPAVPTPDPVPPPTEPARAGQLPEGWAAAVSSVKTGEYGRRLRDLYERLSALTTQPFRVVHLMESPSGFRLHDARFEGDEVVCSLCGSPKTYQCAVCSSGPGAPSVYVLLPAGDLVTYNYPAGYTKLVSETPPGRFHIASVRAPAVLQRLGTAPDEYSVQAKLQWEGTPGTSTSRSSVEK